MLTSFLAASALMALCINVPAQAPHLTITQPGGMPGLPVMTSIEKKGTNGEVELRWDGPSGFYHLMQRLQLDDAQWQPTGDWNTNWAAKVTANQAQAFFSVVGPSPIYAGSAACVACHFDIHQSEAQTRHADALETLKQIKQDENPSCLPCHTVGYGLPTGFTTEEATPYLAGVQCENCHGPAGRHVNDPDDLTLRPQVEIAGQMCGGCHTDAHHPTYDEWVTSEHAEVVEDMNGGRLQGCGRCHSGTSRLAQLAGLSGTNLTAAVDGDANVGVVCAVCHDPHVKTSNGHQLRNPTISTNDYFVVTSGTLLSQYNPAIDICAQCHNHRGAQWDDSGRRPPHHSPQYNILLATVGEYPQGYMAEPAVHAGTRSVTNGLNQVLSVSNQCATCHMQTEPHQEGPPEVVANTGHKFTVDTYGACLGCHAPFFDPDEGETLVQDFLDYSAMITWSQILETKALLDEWATNDAPAAITNYGALAWEYQNSGDLSEGDGPPAGPDGQDWIPDNIKKARFNLYLVLYDGSYGLHNGPYARDLLRFARDWVRQEMQASPE